MPRGRAAGFAGQQEAILEQAATLFAARGFQGTSMLDIAAATGVSKALLYHYYEDKYQLLVAIAEGHIDRLTALVDDVDGQSLPARARFEALLRRFVGEYANARAHHQVLVQDIKYLDPGDERRIRHKERAVVKAFAAALAAAWPAAAGRNLHTPLTMLLFGMINWLFTWFRDDGPLDYPALSELVIRFVAGGVAALAKAPAEPPARAGRQRPYSP